MSNVAGWPACPGPLGGEQLEADDGRGDLVVDDALDLRQRLVLVTGVGLADDARRRVDPGHQRGAMGHVVVAAPEFLLERSTQSHRLYAGDHPAGVYNHFAQHPSPMRHTPESS